METNREQEIAQLLREGLDAYGIDDLDGANAAWQRVLELDPQNADAQDYIQASGRPASTEAPAPAPVQAAAQPTLLEESVALAAGNHVEDAWELLEGGTIGTQADLQTLAVMDLVRARLVPLYRERFPEDAVPRLSGDTKAAEGIRLPPAAGHLISLCDGSTSVSELVALAGSDVFDVLHNLNGLVRAGLVSVEA